MKKIITLSALLLGVIFLNGCGWPVPSPVNQKPVPPDKKTSQGCEMESCHGLDITCGPNGPRQCDAAYAAGDNCRHYASCQIVDGKCQLVKTQKFDDCKSCVDKCSASFKNDQIKFFGCESACR